MGKNSRNFSNLVNLKNEILFLKLDQTLMTKQSGAVFVLNYSVILHSRGKEERLNRTHSFVFMSTFIEEFQHAYCSPQQRFSGSSQNLNFFVCLQNEHFAHEQIKDYRIRFLNSQHAHGAPTISYSYFDK